VFGLSRETAAKMCRFSLPPGYARTKPVGKPKLGCRTSAATSSVDRHHTGADLAQIAHEPAETARERRRIEQSEDARKGVVVRHPVLQAQELPEQILAIDREIEVPYRIQPAATHLPWGR
jgi:hypothetical protein